MTIRVGRLATPAESRRFVMGTPAPEHDDPEAEPTDSQLRRDLLLLDLQVRREAPTRQAERSLR